MTWYSIILLILAAIVLVGGIMIVISWWNPLTEADEEGEKTPLTRKEKATVGGFMVAILLTILTFLFSANPVWLEKLRGKGGVEE